MEDAHVVHIQETWGFFGVFDGHGGSECSNYIGNRLEQELTQDGKPADDEAVRSLMLRLDSDFLAKGQKSGSTGTFVIVELDNASAGKHLLRVGNIGDSRVLLGRADGSIFEGTGTDYGLTTDHKPDHPSEKARIIRSGGTVQHMAGNVARVNGELAVSRAFGDEKYKRAEGMLPEQQAVSAEPEQQTYHCDYTDFLVLVCDGVSEGDFPNAEVVDLAAAELQQHGDPGRAACAVCRRALQRQSKDNITCMIVLLSGGAAEPSSEFLPGPYSAPDDASWLNAYEAAAKAANLTLVEAVEKRYDLLCQDNGRALWTPNCDACSYQLMDEKATYGDGPPCEFAVGSADRHAWFETWMAELLNRRSQGPPEIVDCAGVVRDPIADLLASLTQRQPQARPPAPTIRSARVLSEDIVRPAVESHAALRWNDKLVEVCGREVGVLEDDASDGTSKVLFSNEAPQWIPTAVLVDV
jgi:protein phosphatase